MKQTLNRLIFVFLMMALPALTPDSVWPAATATIQLVGEAGIQVFVDGNLLGTTNAAEGGLILRSLPPGSHTLQLVKPGYVPKSNTLSLAPGEVKVLHLPEFSASAPAPGSPAEAPTPAADRRTSLAIYPIKPAGSDAALAAAMTSLLATRLTPSTKLRVIEEAMLKTVMERQGLNASDACDDTSCQVDLGKLVKAQKLVTGDLTKFGPKFILALKVVDIQTGVTDFTTEDKCSCSEDQLEGLVATAAAEIRNKFGENVPVPELPGTPIAPPPAAAAPAPAPVAKASPSPSSTQLEQWRPKSDDPIFLAVFAGNAAKVQELLAQNPGLVNLRDGKNNTPLHYALAREIAELLLAKGADVNASGQMKATPIQTAACLNLPEVAEVLLAHGANPNVTVASTTPLHNAAFYGSTETAEVLLAHGANVNARSFLLGTPLKLAQQYKHPEVAEVIRRHGGTR